MEQGRQLVESLARVPTSQPESAQRDGEPGGRLDVIPIRQPPEGGAEVAVVGLEPAQPLLLLRAVELLGGPGGEARIAGGVSLGDKVGRSVLCQPVGSEGADGLELAVAAPAGVLLADQEGLVDE